MSKTGVILNEYMNRCSIVGLIICVGEDAVKILSFENMWVSLFSKDRKIFKILLICLPVCCKKGE